MSQPATKKYPAAFKERAVKLAVESDQPIAQTVRDLGVNETTLHTWIGKYHRAERQGKEVNDAHLYDELTRLRTENARLKEERAIVKKAAAYCAQQLPYRTPGCNSSAPSARSVACVSSWRSRAVAPTSGSAAHPVPKRTSIRRCKKKYSAMLPKGVAPTAHAVSSLWWRRTDCR